jgi:hypothetical protein
MSNKRLVAILGGCIAVIVALVAVAAFPPASGEPADGEPDGNSAFHINVIPEQPEPIDGVPNYLLRDSTSYSW